MQPPAAAIATALPAAAAAPRRALADRYVTLLLIVLAGYATFGKGFAYLGFAPVFIGEITLALGLLALLGSGCWLAMLLTGPSLLIALLIGWVVLRTLPYLEIYGFDALRDSVIAVYGLFAFVVAALLLQKPERLGWAISAYSRFALFYGFVGVGLAYATSSLSDLVALPFSGLPLVFVRMGEASVHLCAAAVFVLLGLRSAPLLWTLAMLAGFLMISVSRGAMLSFVIPLGLAAVLGGKIHRLMPIVASGAAIFAIVFALGLQFEISGGRVIGPVQLLSNVESMFGHSEVSNLDGTKTWRLRWWQSIQDYTLHGPYFWTGKGFGVNLAEADGYVVGQEPGGVPLRAPHNAHLHVLARAGVPGLLLWVLTAAAWFAMLARGMLVAHRNGDGDWHKLFVWIACYGLSMLINASFDVALEGPMQGIWYWCIVGLGIGASMLYRTDCAIRAEPVRALAPEPPARRQEPVRRPARKPARRRR